MNTSPLLLGIDVGTYSSKAVLATLQGEIMASAVVPHGIDIPQPGHVEQDADAVWWHDVCHLSRTVLAEAGVAASRVAALAVSAIGPCLLPLDAGGRPLRPAMLYGVDTRAAAQIDELEARIGRAEIMRHARMALTSQAMGPKALWLRQQEPAIWGRTAHLTSATAYLVYRLTGRLCMDHHTASYFAPLYDAAAGQWGDAFASGLVDRSMLPELAWAVERAGTLSTEAASATGLLQGTPVAVGTIDAMSEALSVGAVRTGDLMLMHDSTTFFVHTQAEPTPDERVWAVAGLKPDHRVMAAGMATTGSLTRWIKDEFARDLPEDDGYAQLYAAAAQVPPGAGGLLMLPYFSGERTPINDARARGVIAGLTLSTTREQLFRAALESVGFGIRHNLEAFAGIGARIERIVAVGGGAQSDIGLQIFSDVAGIVQEVPAVTIGASYGDAFLAGMAAGFFDHDELSQWVRVQRRIEPRTATKTLYDALYADYIGLYRATAPIVHRIGRRPQGEGRAPA